MNEPDTAAIAHVNGDYLPLHEARISVLDRGFLFADSIYEVIPVYAGQCYRLGAHLQRLQHSLDGIGLANPHTNAEWTTLFETLVAHNGGADTSVYLQVTRGADAHRDHHIPVHPQPTIIAFCQPPRATDPALFDNGVRVVTLADTRRYNCSIKSTALLANVLIGDQAQARGAAEALLVRDGQVLEGASSNVFVVIDGCITTPTLRDTILAGITRGAILELAARHDLAHAEVDTLTVPQIIAADEVWITSSTREIYPVTQVDEHSIGTGRPGPMWARMFALLQTDTRE